MSTATRQRPADRRSYPRFRPIHYVSAFAVVLKPREIVANAEGKSEMLCSAVIFGTEDSVYVTAKPTSIIPDALVNAGRLYRQLAQVKESDGVLIGYVGQGEVNTTYNTRPWVIRELDPDTEEKISLLWKELVS